MAATEMATGITEEQLFDLQIGEWYDCADADTPMWRRQVKDGDDEWLFQRIFAGFGGWNAVSNFESNWSDSFAAVPQNTLEEALEWCDVMAGRGSRPVPDDAPATKQEDRFDELAAAQR